MKQNEATLKLDMLRYFWRSDLYNAGTTNDVRTTNLCIRRGVRTRLLRNTDARALAKTDVAYCFGRFGRVGPRTLECY